jgi:hypothetical protein
VVPAPAHPPSSTPAPVASPSPEAVVVNNAAPIPNAVADFADGEVLLVSPDKVASADPLSTVPGASSTVQAPETVLTEAENAATDGAVKTAQEEVQVLAVEAVGPPAAGTGNALASAEPESPAPQGEAAEGETAAVLAPEAPQASADAESPRAVKNDAENQDKDQSAAAIEDESAAEAAAALPTTGVVGVITSAIQALESVANGEEEDAAAGGGVAAAAEGGDVAAEVRAGGADNVEDPSTQPGEVEAPEPPTSPPAEEDAEEDPAAAFSDALGGVEKVLQVGEQAEGALTPPAMPSLAGVLPISCFFRCYAGEVEMDQQAPVAEPVAEAPVDREADTGATAIAEPVSGSDPENVMLTAPVFRMAEAQAVVSKPVPAIVPKRGLKKPRSAVALAGASPTKPVISSGLMRLLTHEGAILGAGLAAVLLLACCVSSRWR